VAVLEPRYTIPRLHSDGQIWFGLRIYIHVQLIEWLLLAAIVWVSLLHFFVPFYYYFSYLCKDNSQAETAELGLCTYCSTK